MRLDLPKSAVFVAAISGGVDSMVMLDLLLSNHTIPKKNIIVVHLDHGIRADSKSDRLLVEQISSKNGLAFYFKAVNLGKLASEAKARQVRYEFLNSIAKKTKADYILTAHHQDDLIETAIINIIRGTNRKGLTSLSSSANILRPLLKYSKAEILTYAERSKLVWREDLTNNDERYLRNYVRKNIAAKLNPAARSQLLRLINNTGTVSKSLDKELLILMNAKPEPINKTWFVSLPHNVSREVLSYWLRQNDIGFTRKTLERLVINAKVGHSGQKFPIQSGQYLRVYKGTLALQSIER